MRIGQGFDIHALVQGRKLIVGGVEIPYVRGLAGHSDADVLLHAVTDAVLGAAALGDIGTHFPDSDSRYRGVDSRSLLREVGRVLAGRALCVVNVDATIIAEAPKMAPHIQQMRQNIADDLALGVQFVSVKAKTAEHLGALGRGEGIAAQAVVLVTEVRGDGSG